jgi:hypothetical protein
MKKRNPSLSNWILIYILVLLFLSGCKPFCEFWYAEINSADAGVWTTKVTPYKIAWIDDEVRRTKEECGQEIACPLEKCRIEKDTDPLPEKTGRKTFSLLSSEPTDNVGESRLFPIKLNGEWVTNSSLNDKSKQITLTIQSCESEGQDTDYVGLIKCNVNTSEEIYALAGEEVLEQTSGETQVKFLKKAADAEPGILKIDGWTIAEFSPDGYKSILQTTVEFIPINETTGQLDCEENNNGYYCKVNRRDDYFSIDSDGAITKSENSKIDPQFKETRIFKELDDGTWTISETASENFSIDRQIESIQLDNMEEDHINIDGEKPIINQLSEQVMCNDMGDAYKCTIEIEKVTVQENYELIESNHLSSAENDVYQYPGESGVDHALISAASAPEAHDTFDVEYIEECTDFWGSDLRECTVRTKSFQYEIADETKLTFETQTGICEVDGVQGEKSGTGSDVIWEFPENCSPVRDDTECVESFVGNIKYTYTFKKETKEQSFDFSIESEYVSALSDLSGQLILINRKGEMDGLVGASEVKGLEKLFCKK